MGIQRVGGFGNGLVHGAGVEKKPALEGTVSDAVARRAENDRIKRVLASLQDPEVDWGQAPYWRRLDPKKSGAMTFAGIEHPALRIGSEGSTERLFPPTYGTAILSAEAMRAGQGIVIGMPQPADVMLFSIDLACGSAVFTRFPSLGLSKVDADDPDALGSEGAKVLPLLRDALKDENIEFHELFIARHHRMTQSTFSQHPDLIHGMLLFAGSPGRDAFGMPPPPVRKLIAASHPLGMRFDSVTIRRAAFESDAGEAPTRQSRSIGSVTGDSAVSQLLARAELMTQRLDMKGMTPRLRNLIRHYHRRLLAGMGAEGEQGIRTLEGTLMEIARDGAPQSEQRFERVLFSQYTALHRQLSPIMHGGLEIIPGILRVVSVGTAGNELLTVHAPVMAWR
jgi:hypothetical protein